MDRSSTGTWEHPSSGRRRDRVRAYGNGRVCDEPGCTTVLSIYNPSSRCALHQQRDAILRFRRVQMAEELRHCVHCGAEFTTTNPKRRYCSSRCRSQAFALRAIAAREHAATTEYSRVAGTEYRRAA